MEKIIDSFLCQNFGAIRGMNANDNKTTTKGIDKMIISDIPTTNQCQLFSFIIQ